VRERDLLPAHHFRATIGVNADRLDHDDAGSAISRSR
jgi:hypothetical protein